MSFEAPRGMRDFLPEDMRIRNWIFDTWRHCAELSSFDQYDGCVVETQELLVRKAGEEVVDQIYAFKDKSERELALRPEMTPSLARMINSQGKALALPAKWFGVFQCFRYERMTLGRKREHYQWNLDIIGQADVTAEAEVLRTALSAVEKFGLTSEVLKIRVGSRKLLSELLDKLKFNLAHFMDACMVLDKRGKVEDSVLKEMLTTKGISNAEIEILFKVLEIKSLSDVESILGAESVSLIEIKKLFRLMDISGYGNYLTFDIAVIRGLAYYTGIVFEAFDVKGRHRAIFGGGRYDNLLASLGGDSQPCVGLGFGDVVIYELMKDEGLIKNTGKQVDVTIAYMDVSGEEVAVKAASLCRKSGLTVNLALEPQKPKKIFAQADKYGARFVYLIGPDEAKINSGNLKNLKSGEQSVVALLSLAEVISKPQAQ